jgi:hypothetical protein
MEKRSGGEHPEIVDRLAKEGAKIPAIERKKHIGAREGGAKDGFVLGDMEKQRPIKSQFVILDHELVLEFKPDAGCGKRQLGQILTHLPKHPPGNNQLPSLRGGELKDESRCARLREAGGESHAAVEKDSQWPFRKRSPSASSSASMEESSSWE